MTPEIINLLRHILQARMDCAEDDSAYTAWASAKDIVELALAGKYDNLAQFDYLPTRQEMEEADQEWDDPFDEVGFDPYMGCYSDDC